MIQRPLAQRKEIGAYYTPSSVAGAICNWAIRKPEDSVLEPSFGGCEFINTAKARFIALGRRHPASGVFGADIDADAFEALDARHMDAVADQFVQKDFLTLNVSDFGVSHFDAVIGNPPYIRHHALSDAQRQIALAVKANLLPDLPMQANLWAFFVLHACTFLVAGGRAGWVLPSSFLHARYAKMVREFLAAHFQSVRVLNLNERIFHTEGAEERSVIVLADGWCASGGLNTEIQLTAVGSVKDLPRIIQKDVAVANQIGNIYEEICPQWFMNSSGLGEVSSFRIGLVTGDSSFFIFDGAKADLHSLTWKHLRPVVAGARSYKGITLSKGDVYAAFDAGADAAIIDSTGEMDEAIRSYISLKDSESINNNVTFGKRAVWHQPFDQYGADAFFTSMSHNYPRVILNSDGLDCTNSLYRMIFDVPGIFSQRTIALSMISTLGQFSSEVEGRSYSAGLLKHEPSDARRIRIFAAAEASNMIDDAFKCRTAQGPDADRRAKPLQSLSLGGSIRAAGSQ